MDFPSLLPHLIKHFHGISLYKTGIDAGRDNKNKWRISTTGRPAGKHKPTKKTQKSPYST